MESNTMMRLSDIAQVVIPRRHDIRGRKVLDGDGNEIGRVDDLLIDLERKKVRLLRVEHDEASGARTMPFLIPVEVVERLTDDEVGVVRTKVQVAEAPEYDPGLIDGDAYLTELYTYYGYLPYWMPGHVAPARGFFR